MKNFLGAHNHFISAINDEMKVFIGNVLEKAQQFREFLRTKLEQLDSTVADVREVVVFFVGIVFKCVFTEMGVKFE